MADILLPPWISVARTRFRYLDNTGISRSPYNGPTKTASFGGDRLMAALEFSATGGAASSTQMQRAALVTFLAGLRGRQNRAVLFDHAHRQRGSYPANEVLVNTTFESGTAGWAGSSGGVITIADRTLKVMREDSTVNYQARQPITGAFVQYAPYVARAHALAGRGLTQLVVHTDDTVQNSQASGPGYMVATLPSALTTNGLFAVLEATSAGGMAGDYFSVLYTSVTRCALVDNGVNYLTYSDEFNNAAWGKSNCTVANNVRTAPDGTTTGDDLVDNAVAAAHYLQQNITVSSDGHDICFTLAVRPAGQTWCWLYLQESAGSTTVDVYFNLATGAVGSVGIGANWNYVRTFVRDLGDSWKQITVVARKTNAATSIVCIVAPATGNGGSSYSGSGTAAISLWRATAGPSPQPMRLTQTTSAATGGTSQSGAALHLKGLPVNTNGLLLPNDQVEIITSRGSELKILTTPLNSDASGLGYLQFEPPLRGTPTNDAAVIINQPMGRFIFVGEMPEWANEPGVFTTASADFEEAA